MFAVKKQNLMIEDTRDMSAMLYKTMTNNNNDKTLSRSSNARGQQYGAKILEVGSTGGGSVVTQRRDSMALPANLKINDDPMSDMDPAMASLLRLKLGMPQHYSSNSYASKRAHSSLQQPQMKEWGEITRFL